MKKRILSLLVLLVTAVMGAWAQTETLLTTITATGKDSYSETTPGVVTVTHDNNYFDGDFGWLWESQGSMTVKAKDGYTITKCVFSQPFDKTVTVSTAPFKVNIIYNEEYKAYICEGSNPDEGTMDGVLSIEVYGYASYSVTMPQDTPDAEKWTAKAGTGDYQSLPLEGVAAGTAVNVKYSGTKMVKSVKAKKKAAAPSVPDGAINGKFSVSDTKQVYFSKGNLRYASGTWSFFDNQYDYYNSYSADAWDHFGWSTSATTYGMNTSTNTSTYSGDFVDWGSNSDLQTALGTGWFTLSSAEWTYLFNTRTVNGGTGSGKSYTLGQSVNSKPGVVIYPDNYTGEVYSGSDWATFESAGCVFLPIAGLRSGTNFIGGNRGCYWSSTICSADDCYYVNFDTGAVQPQINSNRRYGLSVRLVREVATPAGPTDLSTISADYEAKDGETLTGTLTNNVKISIADGATVTLKDVTITNLGDDCDWAGINCPGDATLVLEGTNEVCAGKGDYGFINYPGIWIAPNKTLTIQGAGNLTAYSGGPYPDYPYGAGIGGGFKISCGNIVINSGTITATGGYDAAGIGIGGGDGSCGNITINGGTITATGDGGGAGIGGGYGNACGNITISGGTVSATGGYYAAGIGGGRSNGACGTITIKSTVTSVTATKGSVAPNSIGSGGENGTAITVTIGGNEGAITTSPYTYDPSASAGPTASTLAESTVGMIVGTDGKAYAVADKDNLPSGVTAAGMVAYKSGSNGLAIALADEASQMNWSTANGGTGAAAHTPTVTGYSWKLPSMDEWNMIVKGLSGQSADLSTSDNYYYTAYSLKTKIEAAGGTGLQYGDYWSSTEYSGEGAWFFNANSGKKDDSSKGGSKYVRSAFAF